MLELDANFMKSNLNNPYHCVIKRIVESKLLWILRVITCNVDHFFVRFNQHMVQRVKYKNEQHGDLAKDMNLVEWKKKT